MIFNRKPPRKWNLNKYTYTLSVSLVSGERLTVKRTAREILLPGIISGKTEVWPADTWDEVARRLCKNGFILNDVFYPGHRIGSVELVGTEEQTFEKEEGT